VLITPPEDFMREHGVLKRILLVYREVVRRIERGEPVPDQELEAAARIIRYFIEGYHEHMEERYVFPRLRQAGVLKETIIELYIQHGRGRILTTRILGAVGKPHRLNEQARQGLSDSLTAFVRMYEPHEAREDTVIYPAFREIVSAREFVELGEMIEDEGDRRFGAAGFFGFVDRVADIERRLGIYELSKFTARV
jgi:hemerythrin-like domain-containing protein